MLPATLVTAVRERDAILFVGAGVSMNLGLPSFAQLVDQIGAQYLSSYPVVRFLAQLCASVVGHETLVSLHIVVRHYNRFIHLKVFL